MAVCQGFSRGVVGSDAGLGTIMAGRMCIDPERNQEGSDIMDIQSYQTLALETPAEHLLVVRINRPEVRNAISTQVGHDMLDVFSRLIADHSPFRCVILTGT